MLVISGVSGHVGSVAANKLLDERQNVRVIVRSEEKAAPWQKKGAETLIGSLEDEAFLSEALKDAAGFFVLLPPVWVDSPVLDVVKRQHEFADHIAAAVKKSGVKHVVLLSSVGADLKEGNGPIKGLYYFEKLLRETGTQLTTIRPSYFQENVAHVVGAAQQGGIYPSFFSAELDVPMVATKDIGQLVATALMHPAPTSEIIDLIGISYSARQIASKLGDVLDKEIQLVVIPPAGSVQALMDAGFPTHLAEIFAELYAAISMNLLVPRGDRGVQGTTPIDELLKSLVASKG